MSVHFWAAWAVLATFKAWASAKVLHPEMLALLQKDSPCSADGDISRDQCLSKSAECMWLELDGGNLCLPCSFHGVNIPCAPMGSIFAMRKVHMCEMKCAHQLVVSKTSACTDLTGDITQAQCFAKGMSADQTCMWTTFTSDLDGSTRNVCGPCMVEGVGKIPPFAPGNLGPEPNTTVDGCASMCDAAGTEYGMPCSDDPTNLIAAVSPCGPTVPPPPPPKAPVPLDVLRIAHGEDAPEYFAVPVDAPYGPRQYTEASEVAAQAAGWPAPGNPLPPDAPVVIYGPPPFEGPTIPPMVKVMYGPAPPGIPGVPPPGYGMGTAPPPAMVDAAEKQNSFAQVASKLFGKRTTRFFLGPDGH